MEKFVLLSLAGLVILAPLLAVLIETWRYSHMDAQIQCLSKVECECHLRSNPFLKHVTGYFNYHVGTDGGGLHFVVPNSFFKLTYQHQCRLLERASQYVGAQSGSVLSITECPRES